MLTAFHAEAGIKLALKNQQAVIKLLVQQTSGRQSSTGPQALLVVMDCWEFWALVSSKHTHCFSMLRQASSWPWQTSMLSLNYWSSGPVEGRVLLVHRHFQWSWTTRPVGILSPGFSKAHSPFSPLKQASTWSWQTSVLSLKVTLCQAPSPPGHFITFFEAADRDLTEGKRTPSLQFLFPFLQLGSGRSHSIHWGSYREIKTCNISSVVAISSSQFPQVNTLCGKQ